MAKVNYDAFAGIHRIAQAEATVDQRAAVILTFHAALEREIDIVLGGLIPHAHRIRHFGFGQKIDVLAAVWKGDDEAGVQLHSVLKRFNDLRNSVAHGDEIDKVERFLGRLVEAYRAIISDTSDDIEIGEMAQGICSFMADSPTPKQLMETIAALEKLVNITMPAHLTRIADAHDRDNTVG